MMSHEQLHLLAVDLYVRMSKHGGNTNIGNCFVILIAMLGQSSRIVSTVLRTEENKAAYFKALEEVGIMK